MLQSDGALPSSTRSYLLRKRKVCGGFALNSAASFLNCSGLRYARRAAASNLSLTHSVFASPDAAIARLICWYSGGDRRVEMNLPRRSWTGKVGRPIFVSFVLIHFVSLFL